MGCGCGCKGWDSDESGFDSATDSDSSGYSIQSHGVSLSFSLTGRDLARALKASRGACGCSGFALALRLLSYSLVVVLSVLFILFMGPGDRPSPSIGLATFRRISEEQGGFLVSDALRGEELSSPNCHREKWLFFMPMSAGILASFGATNILFTAGSWHFWIAGIYLHFSCVYGWATALDECILALRQGFALVDGRVYLICPLGYVEEPHLDRWILQHYRFITSKITSLVLRGAVQLILALWVEATVLYRLKCMKAFSGHARSPMCIQLTFLWWIQILLLPSALLPSTGLSGLVRRMLCIAFLVAYLLGAIQLLRMLRLILTRLGEYRNVAREQEDSEEALLALTKGRERVRRQCFGYMMHVIFTVTVGTLVVVSNNRAFDDKDGFILTGSSEDFSTLLKISFFLPAIHILLLIGGPYIMNSGNATIGQQSQFCAEVRPKRQKRSRQLEPGWFEKVVELSERGITVQELLAFYRRLGKDLMPHYDPTVHTTRDVVRLAIIPMTRETGRALAEDLADEPRKVQVMVTHTWENLFRDLVAAVVADALEENTFDLIAHVLQEDSFLVESMIAEMEHLQKTYWICAFAVNQHTSICNINPAHNVDSLTKQLYPLCDCNVPKFLNNSPPLDKKGRSIQCELNKFDHMMAIIAREHGDFAQVLAIDQDFGLFHRAWCVAELAEARLLRMPTHVKIPSKNALAQHMEGLRFLKVQDLQATRPEDVEEILGKIPDFESFNQALHELIFDPQLGILATWSDLDAARQMEEVGRLLRWGRADAGRGLVWSSW